MSTRNKIVCIYAGGIVLNGVSAGAFIYLGKFNPGTMISVVYCVYAAIRICLLVDRPRNTLLSLCHLVRVAINSLSGKP